MEQKLNVQIKVCLRSASFLYIQVQRICLNYLMICFYLVYQGTDKISSDGIFAELTDCKEAEERTNSDGIFAEQTDNKEAEIILSMEVEVYTFSFSLLCL